MTTDLMEFTDIMVEEVKVQSMRLVESLKLTYNEEKSRQAEENGRLLDAMKFRLQAARNQFVLVRLETREAANHARARGINIFKGSKYGILEQAEASEMAEQFGGDIVVYELEDSQESEGDDYELISTELVLNEMLPTAAVILAQLSVSLDARAGTVEHTQLFLQAYKRAALFLTELESRLTFPTLIFNDRQIFEFDQITGILESMSAVLSTYLRSTKHYSRPVRSTILAFDYELRSILANQAK
jgi:hypothetical protein